MDDDAMSEQRTYKLERIRGVLCLTIRNGDVVSYWLETISHDFGRAAFRLTKLGTLGAEVYSVLLDEDYSTCDCPGHIYKGHCKHVDCLAALVATGKIGQPLAREVVR
jgi:hypothetical protein